MIPYAATDNMTQRAGETNMVSAADRYILEPSSIEHRASIAASLTCVCVVAGREGLRISFRDDCCDRIAYY